MCIRDRASSVGSLVHIDFADVAHPVIENVNCDLAKYGYSLCITDTKGSHADLTPDYAAVPTEMRAAAAVLGQELLHGITLEQLLSHAAEIREKAGDRAYLRAIHFVTENVRVQEEVAALKMCIRDRIDTQRQRLYHQHIRELIYDHTRNPVRLAENHTAAGSVHRLLPILPGRFYTCLLYTSRCV